MTLKEAKEIQEWLDDLRPVTIEAKVLIETQEFELRIAKKSTKDDSLEYVIIGIPIKNGKQRITN